MGLIAELKRRNVFRVAAAYAVVSWLVIEVASLAFDAFEAPGWVIKVFITMVVLGFPFAVFFAWAYEMTPDGIRKEREVDRSQSITHHTGRKLDFVIIGVLGAVIGLLLVDKFLLQAPPEPAVQAVASETAAPKTGRSVAVLPFVNMSGDEDNEYFADGISEELLNLLVGIDGLRVPSRTSSFAFKGQNRAIGEIAEELNVAHVLEGSVRKAGNRVRVTAQLIDVASDTHLWSDTYDRELKDIFAIQDDISRQIVDALQVALGAVGAPQREIPTTNMQAHDLYLKGLHRFRNRGERTLMKAVEQLEQAVALDSKFAEAWEALAMVYLVLPGYVTVEQSTQIGPEQALARASFNAQQALKLDPGLVEARAVQALATSQQDANEGLGQFARLIADHPQSGSSRLWYGIELLKAGYLAEARDQFAAAIAVDPASAINLDWMARTLIMLGQPEESLSYASRAVVLGRAFALLPRALLALEQGDYPQFRDLVYQWPSMDLERRAADYMARVGDDRSDQAALVQELLADEQGKFGPASGISFYWLGEAGPYFDRFEHDANANLGSWLETLWYPWARQYRQHPRFAEIAEQQGLLDLWRQRGWPDLCRPAGDGFECD